MKVVINKCYGGFSLSPLAVEYIATLNGKPCYFFTRDVGKGSDSPLIPTTMESATSDFVFYAFSVPNPDEILKHEKPWFEMTKKERKAYNKFYDSLSLNARVYKRNDPDLLKCVKNLGKRASGRCANLVIVEIPNGTDFEIAECDGFEHIAEKHRTWGHGMNWQPIKTAPKNGQTVDIWSASHGRCVNYQRVEMDATNIFYEAVEAGYGCIRDATHWKISESPEEETK